MKLNNTRKALSIFGKIKLFPGVNEIKDEDFLELLKNPVFSFWIKDRTFRVLENVKKPQLEQEKIVEKEEIADDKVSSRSKEHEENKKSEKSKKEK